jgi:hypothetical protein
LKRISEKLALERLGILQQRFRREIGETYERKARPCSACPTFGACCVDEHFVNVRISRLEARAINASVDATPIPERSRVWKRIRDASTKLEARSGDDQKFSCPLFEKAVGCLVHNTAKPAPCVVHACYENESDLPPDEVLNEQEARIARLNVRVYGSGATRLPLPLALLNAEARAK